MCLELPREDEGPSALLRPGASPSFVVELPKAGLGLSGSLRLVSQAPVGSVLTPSLLPIPKSGSLAPSDMGCCFSSYLGLVPLRVDPGSEAPSRADHRASLSPAGILEPRAGCWEMQ